MPETKGDGAGGGAGSGAGSNGAKQRLQLVGSMEPFTIGEEFDAYLHRFENYLELNLVTDGTYKVQLLTNLIGPSASQKIYKACRPKEPKHFPYSEIVAKCRAIFQGERWSVAEHYKFNKRNQHEGESASDFAIELQALAEYCAFGDFRDTALRDRFVAGLRCNSLKAKLLNEARDSKFDKIVQLAVNAEIVDENVRAMGPRGGVYAVRSKHERWAESRHSPERRRSQRRHRRLRCGSSSSSESSDRCRYRRYTTENRRCYNCNNYGHLANQCRMKKKNKQKRRSFERNSNEKEEESENFKRVRKVSYCNSDNELNIGTLNLSDSDSDFSWKRLSKE